MAAQSSATTAWQGDLARGSGIVTPESKAFPTIEVSWARRTTRLEGYTSPEELLAAAHASCFSMQLAHELAEAGTPPERLEATATVEFEPGEGVKSSHISVRGRVPDLNSDAFADAAQSAKLSCPISGALEGNLDLTVEARLDQ